LVNLSGGNSIGSEELAEKSLKQRGNQTRQNPGDVDGKTVTA